MKLGDSQVLKDGIIWEQIWTLNCQTPPIPKNLKEIDGYGNPKAKFTRTKIPACMVIEDRQIDKVTGKISYTADQQRFIDQEQERIYFTGYWFYVKGVLTWMTGWQYLGLNYWKTKTISSSPFLQYRDRQRRVLTYTWNVWKHTKDKGTTYMKFRQDGATTWAHIMAFWVIMSGDNKFVGLSSSDLELSEENYSELFVEPFKELPLWLLPGVYTLNKNQFNLSAGGQRITKNATVMAQEEGRGGSITLKALTKRGFDGRRVDGSFPDEAGKWKKVAISKWWAKQTPGLYGFAFIPTTVEEIEDGGQEYKVFWDMSDVSTMEDMPHTASKCRNLFLPSSDGRPKFIGPYGESIRFAPTDEQWAFMKAENPEDFDTDATRMGAKEYQERRLAQLSKQGYDHIVQEERRMFPETVNDAFTSLNPFCPYESIKLEGLKQSASAPSVQAQIRRGYFQNRGQGTEIVPVWREDPKGPWERGPWEPSAETIGQYKVQYGMRRPLNHKVGCIGLDTYAKSDIKGRGSNQGLSGRLFFNRKYEDANKAFRASYGSNMPGYFHTPAKFAYYAHRHPQSGWDHEQVMLCALYYSMPISLENNRSEAFQNYMIQHGMGGFMLREYEILNVPMTRENDVIGLFTGNEINRDGHISKGCEYTNEFLRGDGVWLGPHTYDIVEEPMRFPFLKGIQDHLDFDLTDRTKSDYSMADNMASVAEWNICGWGDEFGYLSTHYTTPEKGIRPGFFVTRRRA